MNRAERRALQFGHFSPSRPYYNRAEVPMLSLERDQVDAFWESQCVGRRTFFDDQMLWAFNVPDTAYAYTLDEWNRRTEGLFYE